MSALQVCLFGKFQMRQKERELTGLESYKIQELFSYLLLFRDRPHSREILADLLWGQTSTAQSKSYLRKTLWQLQTALDAYLEPTDSRVLLVESDWVQINPEADLWVDVAEVEQAFTLVQGIRGQELDCDCAKTIQSAVDLYQGDLLEGWYSDWSLYERERLKHLYLAMVDKLMNYCESHEEYEKGITYGMRALRYECARERTHRCLMRLQYLAGDRTAALRQYERCVQALEEELGVRPADRTVALYEQIRTDRLDIRSLRLAEAGPARPVTIVPLTAILGRLRQLQASLTNLEGQVRQDIEAVQSALNRRF